MKAREGGRVRERVWSALEGTMLVDRAPNLSRIRKKYESSLISTEVRAPTELFGGD